MLGHRNFVAYYRVSTDKQGKSGLGLDAQRKAVVDYLNGGTWKLAAEFTEIESGKKSDRPELARALAAAKRSKATLVIAKLDRLARNVHFISGLMETKVKFVAVDMPEATPFMLHINAARPRRHSLSNDSLFLKSFCKKRRCALKNEPANGLA